MPGFLSLASLRARWLPWALALLCAAAGTASAASQPMSAQDVCLMLRSGYSSAEVLKEVAARRLVDPLDNAETGRLREAGADQALITALQSGRYTLSEQEAYDAKMRRGLADQRGIEERAALQQRVAAVAHPRQAPAAPPPGQAHPGDAIPGVAGLLHDRLIVCKGGKVQPYDNQALAAKKYYVLFYADPDSESCQRLIPGLVTFYQSVQAVHPEFEIVLISSETSAAHLGGFLQASSMPWPAVAPDKMLPGLANPPGRGIPCLLLIDDTGRTLSDTYDHATYLGPKKVITDLVRVLNSKPAPAQ